jgi:hypothetical protein
VVDLINDLDGSVNLIVQVGTENTLLTWDLEHRTGCRRILCYDDWVWKDSFYLTEDSDIDPSNASMAFLSWLGCDEISQCCKVKAKSGPLDEFAASIGQNIDILVVDGDKRVPKLLGFLQTLVPLVRPGGLIVGAGWDGKWSKEVRLAVRSYWAEDEFRVDKLLMAGDYLAECFWKKTYEADYCRYSALQTGDDDPWRPLGDIGDP